MKRLSIALALLLASTTLCCAGSVEEGYSAMHARRYGKAESILAPLANKGDADAAYALSKLYEKPNFSRRSSSKALEWHRFAAELGEAKYQFWLGWKYRYGVGGKVPRDSGEAAFWYRKAAEQGFARAQEQLGMMYEQGEGVERDPLQAVFWYRKAEADPVSHIDARDGLGRLTYDFPYDVVLAARIVREAEETGDPAKQVEAGYVYEGIHEEIRGTAINTDEALRWYQKAAEQNYAVAQVCIGKLYYDGKGVERDFEQAAMWFRKAAEQDNGRAQFYLGKLYLDGEGVQSDFKQARFWLNKALRHRGENKHIKGALNLLDREEKKRRR